MKKSVVFVIVASFTLVSFNANAASIRCGSKSFSSTTRTPQLQSDILKYCGKPTQRNGNVWVYKKKNRRLKFEEGMLIDITIIKK